MKTGDFEAPVAVREKEGERLIEGLTARTPTEGGVGHHTSRRQESDRPEGGSGPPRGQTTALLYVSSLLATANSTPDMRSALADKEYVLTFGDIEP